MEQMSSDADRKDNDLTMVDRFLIAMLSPKEYGRLLREKTGKLVQFLSLLIFIVTMFRIVIPTLAFVAGMGGVKNIIINEIPDFSLENGRFTLEERIEKEDEVSGIYVLCDTEVEKFTKADIPENVVEAVLISKSNMLVYNEITGMTGAVQDTAFSDFKEFTINNRLVADKAGLIYFLMGIIFLAAFFIEAFAYMMLGLFFSLFMFLFAGTFRLGAPVSFGRIYKTSIYAQTIGTIVYAVACCTGNSIFILAGSIFQCTVSIYIMQKVLFPIRRIPTSL